VLSDGRQLTCDSDAACQGVKVDVASWCASGAPDLGGADLTSPAASDLGQVSLDLARFAIPKTGPAYTGPMMDPMLSPSALPDGTLEPNDDAATAITFSAPPDAATFKIVQMAIAPPGDQDWYRIDASVSGLTLKANLFYDITYGDLDVAILDAQGNPLASDGTAVSNGCVAALVALGPSYVVVAGANNTAVNRYEIHIQSFSTPHTCP
jgi:hypothetical protein